MTLNYTDYPNMVKNAIIEISADKSLKISTIEEESLESLEKNKYLLFEIFDNSYGVPNESSFKLNVEDSKDFISVVRSLLVQIIKDGGK